MSSNTLFGSYSYTSVGASSYEKFVSDKFHPARLADLHNASKIFSTMDTWRYLSSTTGYYTVNDWRTATPLADERLPGARHASAVNVLWADSHAGAHKVGEPSNPYNTGMSSSSVKVDGWNYWDRLN